MTPMSPCACETCREMCRISGVMTPQEAEAAMDAGLTFQLMAKVRWVEGAKIHVLAPAEGNLGGKIGYRRTFFDDFPGCVFHMPNGLCAIHATGYKPMECAIANGHDKETIRREDVDATWKSCDGRRILEKWCGLVGFQLPKRPRLQPFAEDVRKPDLVTTVGNG